MSEGRKKKGGSTVNPTPTPPTVSNIPTAPTSPTSPHLPIIGDPFERILTTPKEMLIQRAGSPRRSAASPMKAKGTAEVCLEQLPKLASKEVKLS